MQSPGRATQAARRPSLGAAARHVRRFAAAEPLYPAVLVAAYVIGAFGITHAHASVLVRPLVVGIGAAAVLLLSASIVLHSRQRAGLAVGALVATLAGFGPLVLLAGWWVIARRIAPRLPLPRLPSLGDATRLLNGFAAAWVVIGLVMATPQVLRPATALDPPFEIDASASGERPDIFVLLLDGYARGDTLAGMGYDNEPFLRALEDRGFDVFREASGSYEYTVQVLASMVHGRHLADLRVSAPGSTVDQHRVLMSLIADAPALDELRDIGYEVVTSPSYASHATLWSSDRILDDGGLTEFEYRLLHDTELDRALSLFAPTFMWDAHRDRLMSQFRHIEQLAGEEASKPRFALMHALSPHPPFTFHADGSAAPPLGCYPVDCEAGWLPEGAMTDAEFDQRYVDQLAWTNQLTLDAVDALLADPDDVVIVMSDHGTRQDQENHEEWYRTLFAARTPGHPGAFQQAPHPTALFATIARAYFGTDTEVPATTQWAMIDGNRLNLQPIRGDVLGN